MNKNGIILRECQMAFTEAFGNGRQNGTGRCGRDNRQHDTGRCRQRFGLRFWDLILNAHIRLANLNRTEIVAYIKRYTIEFCHNRRPDSVRLRDAMPMFTGI